MVYDLMDVARKGCAVRQALVSLPNEDNVSLMAASQFARAKDLEPKAFTRVIRELRGEFGFVLIDAPAGIERNLRILTQCEPDETVCVLTPTTSACATRPGSARSSPNASSPRPA